jgi:hypothetical protein
VEIENIIKNEGNKDMAFKWNITAIYTLILLAFLNKYIYRVYRGECARLRENVPYVRVHRYNPKHPFPKLNGYEDNGKKSLKL